MRFSFSIDAIRRNRRMVASACLALTTLLAISAQAGPSAPWDNAGQMVLVITPDWDSSSAVQYTFAREQGQWKSHGQPTPVGIGRAGSAWGIGLHPAQAQGPQKREGDGRSPAGVFGVGMAFGYAQRAETALNYQPMSANHYCMDVDGSALYNQIVDRNEVGADAVRGSTEPMRLDLHSKGDPRYSQGFVIQHNPGNKPGAGSCIFAHLWRKSGESTAGCTAMPDTVMTDLLAWLQPDQHPVFVLLPQAEYARLRDDWKLPVLADGT